MTLHFAYGSNMSSRAMAQRCPGAQALGTAKLRGFRPIIMVGGYASIARMPGALVHGVLWRVTPRDLAALNLYESLDSGLYRRAVFPVQIERRFVSALTYVGRTEEAGVAQPGYLEGVISAAHEWHLPGAYITQLERLFRSGWRGTTRVDTGAVT